MPAVVNLPETLTQFRYFLVRYHRETRKYDLIEPNRANTYDLGTVENAVAYFKRIGLEDLGVRAIDAATAFTMSQASIARNKAFGLDVCRIDPDTLAERPRELDNDRRLLPEDGDDEDSTVFISGAGVLPSSPRNTRRIFK